MIQTIADILKLDLKMGTPSDGGKWGSITNVSAGIFKGLLGDITQGVSDIGFADLFVKIHQLNHVDFKLK